MNSLELDPQPNRVPEFSSTRTGSVFSSSNPVQTANSSSLQISLLKKLRPKQPRRLSIDLENGEESRNLPKKRVLSDFIKLNDEGIGSKLMKEKQMKSGKFKNSQYNQMSSETEIQQIHQEKEPKTRGVEVKVINGQIVVDSSSLNRQVNSFDVDDDDDDRNQFTANTRLRTKRWSAKETGKFYRCLLQCGTDFSLMSKFFPDRTRKELKNKFKHEERAKPDLIRMFLNGKFKKPLDMYSIAKAVPPPKASSTAPPAPESKLPEVPVKSTSTPDIPLRTKASYQVANKTDSAAPSPPVSVAPLSKPAPQDDEPSDASSLDMSSDDSDNYYNYADNIADDVLTDSDSEYY